MAARLARNRRSWHALWRFRIRADHSRVSRLIFLVFVFTAIFFEVFAFADFVIHMLVVLTFRVGHLLLEAVVNGCEAHPVFAEQLVDVATYALADDRELIGTENHLFSTAHCLRCV